MACWSKRVIGCFRLQNWHRGGVLPVCQRSWPHLHHALQVRQASRDTVQVRDTGGSSVWADTRAPHEEYRRRHRTSYCKPLHLWIWIYFIFFLNVTFFTRSLLCKCIWQRHSSIACLSPSLPLKSRQRYLSICTSFPAQVFFFCFFSVQFYPLTS